MSCAPGCCASSLVLIVAIIVALFFYDQLFDFVTSTRTATR